MSFAAIETAINAAALGALTNATMTWSGGGSAAVVFDAQYLDSQGMVNSRPQARAKSTDVSGVALSTTVTINATVYTVQAIEPDGAGMTTLILRKV